MRAKLEELKKFGVYAIQLWYGEDIGCDDLGVPANERKLTMICRPVGCLGSAQLMFVGSVEEFLSLDVHSIPTVISNPPNKEEYKKSGYYLWGTKDGVQTILKNRFAHIAPKSMEKQ